MPRTFHPRPPRIPQVEGVAFLAVDNCRVLTRWSALRHLDWEGIRFFFRPWWLRSPLLLVKRWIWSRCAWCGHRFSPTDRPSFNGYEDDPAHTGPRWFRGEKKLYHSECYSAMKRPEWEAAAREMGI